MCKILGQPEDHLLVAGLKTRDFHKGSLQQMDFEGIFLNFSKDQFHNLIMSITTRGHLKSELSQVFYSVF